MSPFLQQYSTDKGLFCQSYSFSNGHIWIWELDHKETWAPKNWWFWTAVLKTFESPLNWKGSKQSTLKEISPEYSSEGLLLKPEAPILWPHDVKNWLIRKDFYLGKDWRQEEKGTTQDEMVVWHHWFNGQEFKQALGVGDGQGGLVCCSPWGHKESTTTEWLRTAQHENGHYLPKQ